MLFVTVTKRVIHAAQVDWTQAMDAAARKREERANDMSPVTECQALHGAGFGCASLQKRVTEEEVHESLAELCLMGTPWSR